MFKALKYLLFLVLLSFAFSCTPKRKSSEIYFPGGGRGKPSGLTDNCDCGPGNNRRGRPVSRVHQQKRR